MSRWWSRLKYLRLLGIPCPSIRWRTFDFRPWHYVWIDGVKCDWWALESELEDLKERYENDIRFEKIPWWKTFH